MGDEPPDIATQLETYPLPAVDGSRCMCVVGDQGVYANLLTTCEGAPEADETNHKILSEDYSAPFLPDGEYTVRARLSNFKTGVENDGEYNPLQSVDLSIRPDGQIHRGAISLHVTVNPQKPGMVMSESRDEHPLVYGPGTKVEVNTRGAQTPENALDRADHLLQHLLGEGVRDKDIVEDSKLFWELEVYHRIPFFQYSEACETAKDSESVLPVDGRHTLGGVGHDDVRNTYRDFHFRSGRWPSLGFRQTRPMRLKLYRTYKKTDSETLRHPKIEASWGKVTGSSLLHFDKWDQMRRELSALVCSHLKWAGVSPDQLQGDYISEGAKADSFTWPHPQNRLEQLREYYTTTASRLTRALNRQTESLRDVLAAIVHNPESTYDEITSEVEWARRTVQRRVSDLADIGVVSKIRSSCVFVKAKSRVILPLLLTALKKDELTPSELTDEGGSSPSGTETLKDVIDSLDSPFSEDEAKELTRRAVEILEEKGKTLLSLFTKDR